MKRLLVLHTSLGYGGAEKMLAFVINSLVPECEVELVLLQHEEITLQIDERVKVKEKNLYINRAIIGNGAAFGFVDFYKMKKGIQKLIIKEQPDIILCFDLRILVAMYWAACHSSVKILFSERSDPYINPKRWKIILKLIYKHIDYIVFQTEGAKKFYGDIVKNKSCIIPNPAISRNKETLIEEYKYEGKYILAAGQMIKRKGFDILLKAFAKLDEEYKNYFLVLFGEGNEKDNLKVLAKELGCEKRIIFNEPINNVIEKNRSAELFVIPSISEGIPNILIEAMLEGIPSIASDCSPGGARLLSEDGKYCLLAKAGDIDDLAEKIRYGLKHPDTMKHMAKAAAKSMDRFSEKEIARKWRRILQNPPFGR